MQQLVTVLSTCFHCSRIEPCMEGTMLILVGFNDGAGDELRYATNLEALRAPCRTDRQSWTEWEVNHTLPLFLPYICIMTLSFFYCIFFNIYIYTVSPPLFAGVTFLPLPRIIYAVLKRLCMILYTLKYASKTHSRDSFTH